MAAKIKTNARGTTFGTSATQKIAFHGATPIAKEELPAVTFTAPAAISGGESPTEAEFNALRTAVVALAADVEALRAALVDKGLVSVAEE